MTSASELTHQEQPSTSEWWELGKKPSNVLAPLKVLGRWRPGWCLPWSLIVITSSQGWSVPKQMFRTKVLVSGSGGWGELQTKAGGLDHWSRTGQGQAWEAVGKERQPCLLQLPSCWVLFTRSYPVLRWLLPLTDTHPGLSRTVSSGIPECCGGTGLPLRRRASGSWVLGLPGLSPNLSIGRGLEQQRRGPFCWWVHPEGTPVISPCGDFSYLPKDALSLATLANRKSPFGLPTMVFPLVPVFSFFFFNLKVCLFYL